VSGRGDQAASNSAGCGSIPQTRAIWNESELESGLFAKEVPESVEGSYPSHSEMETN
jgi:hypothetical protein